jgi:hypothetical protein
MPAEQQSTRRAPRWRRKRIPGYSPELETAEELNVSLRTLRKWRSQGVGPPYVAIARRFYYSDEKRDAWVKSREVVPVRSGVLGRSKRQADNAIATQP